MTSEIGSDQCHHVTSLDLSPDLYQEARLGKARSHQISATEKTRSELAELYSPEYTEQGGPQCSPSCFSSEGKTK